MKQKVLSKGYTITVVSWENDADNYNTKSIVVDTLEKAKAYYDLMQLCKSKNNQAPGIIKLGNTHGEYSIDQEELIRTFLTENNILVNNNILEDNEDFIDYFQELTYSLLGGSEDYMCRVMEVCTITYSPEDVYNEVIKFE